MKKIILSAIISLTAVGVYAQIPAEKSCCTEKQEKSCCDSVTPEEKATVLSYLDKLKDAYVNQDQGFLMSLLDVDQSTMTDLYNEFMDEVILDADIDDISVCKSSGQNATIKSSFKLSRKGYNFSDNKYVSILWNLSDSNHPKIIKVTTENID